MNPLTLTAEDLRGVEPFALFAAVRFQCVDGDKIVQDNFYETKKTVPCENTDLYLKAWALGKFREIKWLHKISFRDGYGKGVLWFFYMEDWDKTITPPPGVFKAMEILGMEEITREWIES
ncbi:MAG: hypothetical protein KAS32_21360 [Candidatus Peribacteraceae bacterium]|nr:hypothetical protein [Candidatus Peribacteraceae bacterium]